MLSFPSSALFRRALEAAASDVHLVAGYPVVFRVSGELVPQDTSSLTPEDTEEYAKAFLSPAAVDRLRSEHEVDALHELPDGTRVRINGHIERGAIGLAARIIPGTIPTLEQIGIRKLAEPIAAMRHGLVLVTGPSGSGKTTTLASIIQSLHAERSINTVTLEDPIEFLLKPGRGIVRQREFGRDFHSFADSLRYVVRQDPDVVMVGEMRDSETMATAITLAETGHLIFATLHTPNAVQSIDRIIDAFPAHQHPQIRTQLALALRAVLAQRLVPKAGGGRTAVREMLVNTPACSSMIRESRLHELPTALQTGEAAGMVTFERDAHRCYQQGAITKEVLKGFTASL